MIPHNMFYYLSYYVIMFGRDMYICIGFIVVGNYSNIFIEKFISIHMVENKQNLPTDSHRQVPEC